VATVLAEPTGVATEEMVHVSIPILKWEEDGDGDLIVKGVATDGTVDSDEQIVDPVWSAKALDAWISSGGNVRQSHDPHRPVGKGLRVDLDKDGSGKHWVESVIVDPLAQKLVKKGVLTAYSVGISRPVIKHDPTGKARGGLIVGGEFAEISIVDRPSNKSSYLQLAKSAADGTCEFTGKMVGQDALEKMLVTETEKAGPDISSFDAESELFSFTPNDMAKLMKNKIIEQHYAELARDAAAGTEFADFSFKSADDTDDDDLEAIDKAEGEILGKAEILLDEDAGKAHRKFSASERRRHAKSGKALPDGSYPIPDADALRRAAILARSKHGNWKAASRLIARRARELGKPNPMTATAGAKEDIPDLIKDPQSPATAHPSSTGEEGDAASASAGKKLNSQSLDADGDTDGDGDAQDGIPKAAKPKAKKPKKGGKKLPPWLNKPDSDGDGDGKSASDCKQDHAHTEKCHVDPKTASGASEAADMDPAPVGELMESPAPSHMKAQSVSLRYKTIGIDSDMGTLHDFTCPAYHPEEVAGYHPFSDFRTLIDENVWQRKALAAAAGRSIDEAMEAQKAWQAAAILKTADPMELNQFRLDLHKAFRDANPGPTSYPTPCTISAQRYNRPCITDGHSALGPGYGSPNTSAQVATSAPHAHDFSRPPLGGAQQSPSPSFMKATQPYPEQQGVPTQLNYPQIEREKARRALLQLHDHLQHMFPAACPMVDEDAYRVEQPAPSIGPIAGISKTVIEPEQQAEVLSDVYKYIKKLEKQVRAGLITEEEARNKLSKRTAERYARNLVKDVQKGMTSIDEVRKALGIEPVAEKAAVMAPAAPAEAAEPLNKGMTPDVMKTMMSEILEPFQAQIAAQTEKINEYQARLEAQQARIGEYDKRWEALANTANPSTEAFSAALRKNMGPAGLVVKQQAEVSDHVHGMMMRQLERTWRTSENPAEREAAYSALNKMKSTFE
jgi:hypothetical protein